MRRLLSLLLLPLFAATGGDEDPPIRGFTRDGSLVQRRLEGQIKATPSAELIGEYIRVMSEEPHHTGSEAGKRVAEYVLTKFREWGLDAEIEEFDGLMPTPTDRHLEMLEPEHFVAPLREPALAEDKDSSDPGQLPTYNAYSPDGDVAAQVVYVNYGMPEDYETLKELGIDVSGKIVLARYYGGWRGIKPKVAAQHGAIGCLIYSDPRDDGFFQGDAYPKGPKRPSFGVQRGSTMDMPIHPGDPLTPGWGSMPGGRKLEISEAKTLPTIPVLPISADEAAPMLLHLGGPVAPEAWRGALPLTYHVGPGPAKARMRVASDWKITTGYNVIGRIEGDQFPDEWVLYGNHHDAWVNGAADPVSGNAVLMETARTLAERVKDGWKPKRTIIFASWDAEEWGLIGSTEWGEKHADELRSKAVAYLNTDGNRQGVLKIDGSHILERFLNDVARDTDHPLKAVSNWEAIKQDQLEKAAKEDREEIENRPDLRIGALGSGSDYTVFIDHLTIPSVNLRYTNAGPYGVYHSIYDSFDWYRRFGDPNFVHGRALAQFNAVAIARLADANVVPYEFTNLADTLEVYHKELKELLQESEVENPGGDLGEMEVAISKLALAAQEYEEALVAALEQHAEADYSDANQQLGKVERAMGRSEGLPEREWYKHQIYAPGFFTGYGVKTVPGVREAIEQERWDTARRQASIFAEVVRAVSQQVRQARQALGKVE